MSQNELSCLNLPKTVTVLDGPLESKVYVIGTAHFSVESQREVIELIQKVRPDYVMLELCSSRANILFLDEETILRESKDLSLQTFKDVIKTSGIVKGVLHMLLLRLYAQVSEQLSLAPGTIEVLFTLASKSHSKLNFLLPKGGEFRAAFNEAQKIPNCKICLGDMPFNTALKRGFHALPWYRKIRFGFTLLFQKAHKITTADIEKLKSPDVLDSLLEEFGAFFPEFKRVIVDERDLFLTNSLRFLSKPMGSLHFPLGIRPVTVVGVVGMAHVPGIVKNWKNNDINVSEILDLLEVPPSSNIGRYIKYGILASIVLVSCRRFYNSRYFQLRLSNKFSH